MIPIPMTTTSIVRDLAYWQKQPRHIVQTEKDKVESHLSQIERILPDYKKTYSLGAIIPRVMIIALFVLSVIVFALFASGHLLTFPQDFINLFKNIDYIKLVIAGFVIVPLFCGASLIIHRARFRKEETLAPVTLQYNKEGRQYTSTQPYTLIGKNDISDVKVKSWGKAPGRGSFTNMDQHIETVRLKWINSKGNTYFLPSYLDRSTLDSGENGKALLYRHKGAGEHYLLATVISLFGTPFYLVGVVVYNLIRTIIAPLYVIVQMLRESCMDEGESLFPGRRFEASDIFCEAFLSIKRVVQAPFYALAYCMAVVYGLGNPMGGRKLASQIERDWNEGTTIAQGVWCVGEVEPLWQFEGGGSPWNLGRNGFFLAGCYQPFGIAEVKDGVIQGAYYTGVLIEPNQQAKQSNAYTIYSRAQSESLNAQKSILEQALALQDGKTSSATSEG